MNGRRISIARIAYLLASISLIVACDPASVDQTSQAVSSPATLAECFDRIATASDRVGHSSIAGAGGAGTGQVCYEATWPRIGKPSKMLWHGSSATPARS
jgi:hypothetical protein